ncbi:Fic family protein [Isoptericola sp. F-RaC21]|uniref:Fic/DOC family protein n=1 Tax=Isoptericola sp. F-RaC21 TaxID=3141452 RepID=UPI00315B6F2E
MTSNPWEQGDEGARWNGYLLDDRHTLRNLVGARTPEQLRRIEDDLVEARALTLREHGLPTSYDLEGLRQVHRHLFQDVYAWAGDLRTVEIRKGAGWFARRKQIEPAMRQLAEHLRETSNLRSVSAREVPRDLAQVYNIVNHVHPFREGNGRTQREFITALARESGHRLDWTRVTRDRAGYESENDQASREASEGHPTALYEMFARITIRAQDGELDAAALEAVRLARTSRLRAAAYPGAALPSAGSRADAAAAHAPSTSVPAQDYER